MTTMTTMTTTMTTTTRATPPTRPGARTPLLLLLVAATLAGPGVAAQTPGAGPLVDAGWLATRLDDPDLVVLQVGPEDLYREEHVPGARWVGLDRLSKPMPGDGRHDEHLVLQLPEPAALASTLEGLGVGDRSRVVVVPSAGWVTPATRVLFTLDYAGLGDRSFFLDGGLEAWKAAGHPVTAELPDAPGGRLLASPRSERVAGVEEIREGWLRTGGVPPAGLALVDARAAAFYDGVRDDRGKSGHIPGAGSLPWTELFDETDDGIVTLRPASELRALLADAGVRPGDTVVAYCHIGQFATSVLLAARVVGHDVRLFDGSMNQWALLDLPVEVPGRAGR